MARAAGNDPYYSFYLNGNKKAEVIRLPSVTTILSRVYGVSQYVVTWGYNLGLAGGETPKEFRDRRAEEGSLAHAWVEQWVDLDKKGQTLEPETGYNKAWLKFVAEHDPTILASEKTLFSLKHLYAGTLDLILLNKDGAPRIVDLKTKAKTIYKAYDSELIQCRAYGMAAQEMGLIASKPDTAVLILKENGRYTYDEREVSEELWLDTLALYTRMESELNT